jgi:hypothetical protein
MGLPPLAPEVKKHVPATPQSPRLTNVLRSEVPMAIAPVAIAPVAHPAAAVQLPVVPQAPAVRPTAFNDAAGNPLRETAVVNAAATLPDRSVHNGLRSPFEQVAVPIGLPPAANASLIPSQQPAPSTWPNSR